MDEAKEVVKKEQEGGTEVKPEWVGAMYNGVAVQREKREDILDWARTEYPAVWEELERGGMEEVDSYRMEYKLAVRALAKGLDP